MLLLFSLVAITRVAAQTAAPSGQEDLDPSAGARFQWGPLRFTPGISVSDVGIDNNVFNDPNNKLEDTTAAVGPAINLWSKIGPFRLADKSAGQYLYFNKYENQRAWNIINDVRLELPLARFKPFADWNYANTRQRPGFEIDSRSRASTNVAALGTSIRLSGKTTVVLDGTRTTVAFDQGESFLGTQLASALNRYSDDERLQFRYKLTPLTTLTVNTEAIQDRFATDRVRNADSIRVMPGFEFKPFALISGHVAVGVRRFNVLSDRIEDYQGVVAAVDAKYLLTTSTQLSATVDRDIEFSYDETTPYYTSTQTSLTLDQRFKAKWDIAANGTLESLAYRSVRSAAAGSDRADSARVAGLSLGYLVGDILRVGFDVNYLTRRSRVAGRNYDGLRAGASVSYGLQR